MKHLELAATTAQKRKRFDFIMLGHNLEAYINWSLAKAVSALTAMFTGLLSFEY
ncbi:hypothetical protein ACIROD_00625 [Peribacillus sp. NPDC101481]|uniref:hypothetical protein n=1 Tax=unclassified Peribacillus TaxID=2675266 RepID=UPI00382323A8